MTHVFQQLRQGAAVAADGVHFRLWAPDVHHVLHTAATHERTGYYADYEGNTEFLARALAEGFCFQGQVMPYRGSGRGRPSADLPPSAFVASFKIMIRSGTGLSASG